MDELPPIAPPADVLAYYEAAAELGRLEDARGQLERARTQELLLRFLKPESKVLDVGGGTGIYAEWLTSLGHRVHLVEPVSLHLEEARRRARGTFTVEQGDARELSVADGSYDAVVMLGPLYHLSDASARLKALEEARRACRPGAFLAVAAISRFASLLDMLSRRGLEDDRVLANVADELSSGSRVVGARRTSPFPDAYFHTPDEVASEIVGAGFELVGVFGIQGAGWLLDDLEARRTDERAWERVLWAARVVEEERSLLGVSAHLLAVGRRG
jgi:ubiquinone/menaquinone biosynthesis C-methylase UbiE